MKTFGKAFFIALAAFLASMAAFAIYGANTGPVDLILSLCVSTAVSISAFIFGLIFFKKSSAKAIAEPVIETQASPTDASATS